MLLTKHNFHNATAFVSLLCAGIGTLLYVNLVSAAAPNPGITVTPAKLSFILSKDAPLQKIEVTVTNNYDSAINLAAEFKGIDENAGLLIPTETPDQPFVAALVLSETSVQLLPHVSKRLTVQLNNADALAPGGHYATLVLTQQGTNAQNSSLRAAISLTIFGIKTEGAKQALTLKNASSNHWLFRLPSSAELTYSNTGNVHVVPRASVVVPRPGSTEPLLKGVSNANSLPLLPGKTYTDMVPLEHLGTVWLPRHLQFIVAYRIDGADAPRLEVQKFWYIPPLYPIVLLALCLLAFQRKRKRSMPHTTVAEIQSLPPETIIIRPTVRNIPIGQAVPHEESIRVRSTIKASTMPMLKPAASRQPKTTQKRPIKTKKAPLNSSKETAAAKKKSPAKTSTTKPNL